MLLRELIVFFAGDIEHPVSRTQNY